MRSCFIKQVSAIHIAILDLCPFNEDGMLVTRVNVPKSFRGKGHASELLWKCCKEADKEGVTLYLTIMPSDGLTFHQLQRFYERYGFEYWNDLWRRLPNSPIRPLILREHNAPA